MRRWPCCPVNATPRLEMMRAPSQAVAPRFLQGATGVTNRDEADEVLVLLVLDRKSVV